MKHVKPGDRITAEWANRLFDPLRNSSVEDGFIDEDGFHSMGGTDDDSAQFAVLDEDLDTDGDKIGEAEATIWSGDPLADSGTTVTVHNWLLGASETLDAGTRIVVTTISGKLYVIQASC